MDLIWLLLLGGLLYRLRGFSLYFGNADSKPCQCVCQNCGLKRNLLESVGLPE